jgi:galactokinase
MMMNLYAPPAERSTSAMQANATYQRAINAYQQHWHDEPSWVVSAPGRVNLIGEHTDYNDGFVLPCAIDFQTVVLAKARTDHLIRIVAADFQQVDQFFVDAPYIAHPTQQWANYVRGMVQAMRMHGFAASGVDLSVAGDVPQGAGLSSSASLEVAIGMALARACRQDITTTQLAQIGQLAENQFVGCQCGIMDQLVSAQGQAHHALLIDCRSLQTQAVPLPDDMAILIVHSGVRRGLVESAYNERRVQCERVAKHFKVKALRDVTITELHTARNALNPIEFHRARHVISENERTQRAAHALSSFDMKLMGKFMAQSHISMRDDFEITTPHIDHLVGLLQSAIGEHGGARMTGGGFGGCVVALLPQAQVQSIQDMLRTSYQTPEGTTPRQWVCTPSSGVQAQTY